MKRYPQGQVIKSFSRALLNIQCSLSIVLAPLSTKFFLNVRWKRKIFLYVQSKKIINYCNGQRKDILVIAVTKQWRVHGADRISRDGKNCYQQTWQIIFSRKIIFSDQSLPFCQLIKYLQTWVLPLEKWKLFYFNV